MELWIIEDGEKRGPFQSYEVRGRIESGELSGDELAWHQDRDNWVPLRDLDVFRGEFEAEPEAEEKEEEPVVIPEGPPQPFLRFLARWFDIFLYVALVYLLLWVTGQNIMEAMVSVWFRRIWFIPYIILDSLFVHLWKTTPGKAAISPGNIPNW